MHVTIYADLKVQRYENYSYLCNPKPKKYFIYEKGRIEA